MRLFQAVLTVAFACCPVCCWSFQDLKSNDLQEAPFKSAIEDWNSATTFYELKEREKSLFAWVSKWPVERVGSVEVPIGIDVAGYWDLIVRRIESKEVLRMQAFQLVGEFTGYLHGRISVDPPDEWKHYMLHGRLPSNSDEYEGQLAVFGRNMEYQLFGDSLTVKAGDTTEPMTVSRIGRQGEVQWSTDIFGIWPFPKGVGLAGKPNVTVWTCVSECRNANDICIWGIDSFDIAFFVILDWNTGRRREWCFLTPLDIGLVDSKSFSN
ncbi:MAG: hypothetical protein R3C03_00145 [Pirellulaceae bacterium]